MDERAIYEADAAFQRLLIRYAFDQAKEADLMNAFRAYAGLGGYGLEAASEREIREYREAFRHFRKANLDMLRYPFGPIQRDPTPAEAAIPSARMPSRETVAALLEAGAILHPHADAGASFVPVWMNWRRLVLPMDRKLDTTEAVFEHLSVEGNVMAFEPASIGAVCVRVFDGGPEAAADIEALFGPPLARHTVYHSSIIHMWYRAPEDAPIFRYIATEHGRAHATYGSNMTLWDADAMASVPTAIPAAEPIDLWTAPMWRQCSHLMRGKFRYKPRGRYPLYCPADKPHCRWCPLDRVPSHWRFRSASDPDIRYVVPDMLDGNEHGK